MITLDELRALTNDDFNRAVAEVDGWSVKVDVSPDDAELWEYVVEGPDNYYAIGSTANPDFAEEMGWSFIPDYAEDIDAARALIHRHNEVAYLKWIRDAAQSIFTEYIAREFATSRGLTTAWYAWKFTLDGDA